MHYSKICKSKEEAQTNTIKSDKTSNKLAADPAGSVWVLPEAISSGSG